MLKQSEKGFLHLKVGLDGPFGTPATRFSTFDKAIIIGSGIGQLVLTC
jgi:hypothetical protein